MSALPIVLLGGIVGAGIVAVALFSDKIKAGLSSSSNTDAWKDQPKVSIYLKTQGSDKFRKVAAFESTDHLGDTAHFLDGKKQPGIVWEGRFANVKEINVRKSVLNEARYFEMIAEPTYAHGIPVSAVKNCNDSTYSTAQAIKDVETVQTAQKTTQAAYEKQREIMNDMGELISKFSPKSQPVQR